MNFVNSVQLQEFRRALRILDPYLPKEALNQSAGVKIAALQSLIKKQHLKRSDIIQIRINLNRYQKSTSRSNLWLKISLAYLYAAVGSMKVKEKIVEQKQHQLPVCILSRFSDYVNKDNFPQRYRNPRLSELKIEDNKVKFKSFTDKTKFLYPIYGMNEPSVEAFFQQIESIAWAPDSDFNQLFRQAALVILQTVRNFTTPSYEHGKFKYVFNELEKVFANMKFQKFEIIETTEKFGVSLKFMQREVIFANGDSMLVAPVTKNRVIVFHDYLEAHELEKGIAIAQRASIKRPLLVGESVHGVSFEKVFPQE